MKYFVILLVSMVVCAQNNPQGLREGDLVDNDTLRRNEVDSTRQIYEPTASDYRVWTENADTARIDQSLSLKNYYNQNFTTEDTYGYMLRSNLAEGANELLFNSQVSIIPQMGFHAKLFNYKRIEDISYYDVKTPTAEFIYQSGYGEGQMLSSNFTHSLKKTINYSIGYTGIRSLGRYPDQLASNRSVWATINYRSRQGRYKFWTHYMSQNIDNQESGGIVQVEAFMENDKAYQNRRNFTSNLQGASTQFDSRRFHFVQQYGLLRGLKKNQEVYRPITLQHKFTYEKRDFSYAEKQENDYFSSAAIEGKNRSETTSYGWLRNELSAVGNLSDIVRAEFGISYDKIDYGYDSVLVDNLIDVPSKLGGTLISAVARARFKWHDKLFLNGFGQYAFGGDFGNAYQLKASLVVEPYRDIVLKAEANTASTEPDLSFRLHQSFYSDYNYYNEGFDKINTQSLTVSLLSNKYLNARFQWNNIQNYVFVDDTERPKQQEGNLSTFSVTLNKLLRYRDFGWDNTASFQKVGQASDILPLPTYVLRSTLFYQKPIFDQKAELQTGLSLYMFDSFRSRTYFPVLGAYSLQTLSDQDTAMDIGNYPLLDAFFNIRVKRMRIYIKAQHFNAPFSKRNYFSMPQYPYTDWVIRLGIKWFLFT